jgi:hypothetical protein
MSDNYQLITFAIVGALIGSFLFSGAVQGIPLIPLSLASITTSQIVTTLNAAGFTNVTATNSIATVTSGPALMFSAFDANAPGNKNVLVLVFPSPNSYRAWNNTQPSTYGYWLTNTTSTTGTLAFLQVPATSVQGGRASSATFVPYTSWKELLIPVPVTTTTTAKTTVTSTTTATSTVTSAPTTIPGQTTTIATTTMPTTIATTTMQPTTTVSPPPPPGGGTNFLNMGLVIGLIAGIATAAYIKRR